MKKETKLEKVYIHATELVINMQMIADSLFDYNSGLCKKKTPLSVIQYDVSTLAHNLTELYGDIGKAEE